PDSSISSRQLRDFAARILPNYMIPQAILILQRMPLTASGKIDRKALPAHEDVLSDRTQAYVAPGNPIEKTVADIWIELLRLEKVGVHDDFFESGGHSLLATRLISQFRRAFGVEISLRSVFEAPTIAAMSELIQNVRWASGSLEAELPPAEREEVIL
ncbi:MAG TPA: phosphopantetheine-binding protein, partial [Terrimicrobiaceae bacterium]